MTWNPFFNLFRYWIAMWKGLARRKAEKMLENPDVIRNEFREIKEAKKEQWRQMFEATAGKVRTRTEKETRITTNNRRLAFLIDARDLKIVHNEGKDPIQKLGFQLFQLSTAKQNAELKIQKRANVISKSQAETDKEYQGHLSAYKVFNKQIDDINLEMSSLEAQLRSNIDEDASQVRAYNTELVAERANLRAQERQIADLDGRAESMIIDILGAQRAEEARAVFDTSDIDTRLSTLTQVQDKAKARTSVSSEMSSDNIIVNAEYLDNNTATIDLESRLSFMDSHPVEVSRANIDEQLVQIGRTLVEKEHVPQG